MLSNTSYRRCTLYKSKKRDSGNFKLQKENLIINIRVGFQAINKLLLQPALTREQYLLKVVYPSEYSCYSPDKYFYRNDSFYFLKTEILMMPILGENEELYFSLALLSKLTKHLILS